MRRIDILALVLLFIIVVASWVKLRQPIVVSSAGPADPALADTLPTWQGPATARAHNQKPHPLLPVEEYVALSDTQTLVSFFAQQKITVYPEDSIEAFPPIELGVGSQIRLYRATPVEVTDWGKKKIYRTWQTSVQGFLDEQQIEIGDNDKVAPAMNGTLTLDPKTKNAQIVITRVEITEVKVTQKIDYKKVEKEDPQLLRGQKKVTPGKLGKQVLTYRVRREDGQEKSRVLLNTQVVEPPQEEITVIGTKVLIGKSYNGRASWYNYNSTHVASDLFKRGTNLRITNLANGRQIFVTNDGCICADTGYVVDLHPSLFTQLGGNVRDGVIPKVQVDEVLN